MPTVFVVNEPLRKNSDTGEYEKFLPIERAADHGEVARLTPDGTPPGNVEPWLRMIDEGLKGWKDGDLIVLVGDQSLLAYASSIVGAYIKPGEALRVLKWSRHKAAYEPLVLREQ